MLPIDKVVILAGGKGTRISEESIYKPKPLIEIGGIPIILHIMGIFSYYGINNFYILTGYKSIEIKKYFLNDLYRNVDLTIDYSDKSISILKNKSNKWKVNIIETGENSMTGGRLYLAKNYLKNSSFFLAYGDCVSDINLEKLYKNHINSKKIATVTGILQNNRFGTISLNKKRQVKSFSEKPIEKNSLISGGFFVFQPKIFNYLSSYRDILEKEPLVNLTNNNNLNCYHHDGFWHPMDNLRDKLELEKLWNSNKAPWKKYLKKLI